jgi:hypothetical protein
MPVSNALPAFGTSLTISDMNVSPSYAVVGEVKNITGPSGKAAALDASNQDSPNDHKEVKAGFRDGGTVTIEANWYPGNTNGQGRMLTAFQAGTLNDFKIVAPTGGLPKVWSFSGIITGFEPEYPVAGLMGFKATIELSGKPVLADLGV